MNKVFKIPLVLLLTIFFACCKKDNPKILGPEDYRVTYGNQTFGAYLNGQPWVPDYSDPGNGVGPFDVSMYSTGSPGNFQMYMWIFGKKSNEEISVFIPSPLTIGRKYLNTSTQPYPTFGSTTPAYGMYKIFAPTKKYMTNITVTGYVDIIKQDTLLGKIEGVYEFEAIDNITQEKIKITNGYFKRNY